MGFWSTLGSLGGLALAPFTGGASMIPTLMAAGGAAGGLGDALAGGGGPSAVQGVGQTAGSIEAARAKGLVDQARIQQEQDALAQSRAKLALAAPGQEASNSVRGDIVANSKDFNVSGLPSYIHIPQMSGGLRPSMLSQNSRQLGGVMSRNALANQMSGSDVPNLTPLPTSTGLDKVLQGVAGGAGFLSALGKVPGQTPAPVAGGDPNGPGFIQGTGFDPADPTQADPNGLDPALLQWFSQNNVPGGPQ